MKKALFLDRDGVLNREIGTYVFSSEKFEWNKDVFEFLKKAENSGFLLIIVTNQAGIAKNLYTADTVFDLMNEKLKELQKNGISITNYYFSPHHPDYGLSLDRKPSSLMLEKAIARYKIDPNRSLIIGDNDTDIEAGLGAGVKGIKIDSNQALMPLWDKIDELTSNS
jgi:D-glycero-D-manno-heptose 1,7-bisphosphate phosphatase